MVVKPDEIRHPIRMAVTADHDVVLDVVVVQSLEGAVTVGLVAIPGVVVQGVNVAVSDRLVEAGEDGLAANHAPGGLGIDEIGVEPVFLSGTHHGTAGVVGNLMDVMGIPVEVRDGPIVLPGIQHNKIEKRTKGEGAPDAEVVVHLDLPDGHPFEVSTYSVHLPLINSHAAVHDEGGFGVVQL